MKSFCYRAHEGRTVKKGKHRIKVFEVTIHEVEHETHFGELEPHVWGLVHGKEALKIWVSQPLGEYECKMNYIR